MTAVTALVSIAGLSCCRAILIFVDSNLIGVITPYRQQCVKVRQLLNREGYGGVEVKVTEDWQGQVRPYHMTIRTQNGSYYSRKNASLSSLLCEVTPSYSRREL